MSLTDRINQDIKDAMRAKEKEKLAALRDIKAKLLNEAVSGHGEIDEAKENQIIIKMHKQRLDSYNVYIEQGREDLAVDEMFQAEIIQEYMPKMLDKDEIRSKVVATIAQVGATGPQDMGKVMGIVSKDLAGKADGKIVADIVKEELKK